MWLELAEELHCTAGLLGIPGLRCAASEGAWPQPIVNAGPERPGTGLEAARVADLFKCPCLSAIGKVWRPSPDMA
jgi:hypothetical protein